MKNSFFASKLRFCSLIISFSLQTTHNLTYFIHIYTKHNYCFITHQRASNASLLLSFESTQLLPSFKSLRLAYAIPPFIYAVFHVKHWCKRKSASLASKLLLNRSIIVFYAFYSKYSYLRLFCRVYSMFHVKHRACLVFLSTFDVFVILRLHYFLLRKAANVYCTTSLGYILISIEPYFNSDFLCLIIFNAKLSIRLIPTKRVFESACF